MLVRASLYFSLLVNLMTVFLSTLARTSEGVEEAATWLASRTQGIGVCFLLNLPVLRLKRTKECSNGAGC